MHKRCLVVSHHQQSRSQLFYSGMAIVMSDNARGVWGHASPEKLGGLRSILWLFSAKMVLESPACVATYCSQWGDLKQSCQKGPSHVSTFQHGKVMRVAQIQSLFGRLPSVAGMHHLAQVSPTPILHTAFALGCRMENWQSICRCFKRSKPPKSP